MLQRKLAIIKKINVRGWNLAFFCVFNYMLDTPLTINLNFLKTLSCPLILNVFDLTIVGERKKKIIPM